jgi:hypothetical protein
MKEQDQGLTAVEVPRDLMNDPAVATLVRELANTQRKLDQQTERADHLQKELSKRMQSPLLKDTPFSHDGVSVIPFTAYKIQVGVTYLPCGYITATDEPTARSVASALNAIDRSLEQMLKMDVFETEEDWVYDESIGEEHKVEHRNIKSSLLFQLLLSNHARDFVESYDVITSLKDKNKINFVDSNWSKVKA